jgi:hypothetical protein
MGDVIQFRQLAPTRDDPAVDWLRATLAALARREISMFDNTVAGALAAIAYREGQVIDPSIETIAQKVGVAVNKDGGHRAVRAALNRLKSAGLLRFDSFGRPEKTHFILAQDWPSRTDHEQALMFS